MTKLAISGGIPHIQKVFRPYQSIGKEEAEAVQHVMQSGVLSEFLGVWGDKFDGGPWIKKFEEDWSRKFLVKHSISMNSATSGLFAAMGAIGLSPGDEVIVPPYTMSATVMAPLVYGGIPVFVDIEADSFCLDPSAVAEAVTGKTKAIIAVNLFGHPARLAELRSLADRSGIYLIEDNSQAPLAQEFGRFSGTVGDIGIFSLNYHKHVHTGEGGVCVTDSDELALRLRLIRNHGENAAEPAELQDLTNLIGFNYRLTEIAAAIGIEQLKKIDRLVQHREATSIQLSTELSGVEGLTPPHIRQDARHVFYVWSAKYSEEITGIPRRVVVKALEAEGVPSFGAYVKPLYLLPTFQKRIAIGANGFPFTLSDRRYEKGLCPVTERMHEREILVFPMCSFDLTSEDVTLVAEAVKKVLLAKDELRKMDDSPVGLARS